MKDYAVLSRVIDYRRIDLGYQFDFIGCEAKLTFLEPGLFRFRLNRKGFDWPERNWVVAPKDWAPIPLGESCQNGELIVETEKLTLGINLAAFGVTVWDKEGFTLCRDKALGWRGHSVRCWKTMTEEARFYGCGEKVGYLDRRGRKLEMWTTDSIPHLPNTDPMYQSIPFYLVLNAGKAFGIFLNNTHRSFVDFGKEDPESYSFWVEDGPLDYYLFAGPSIGEVLEGYTGLTGRMPLPPKWSLGFQQSRYSYYPESRVREVATEFRRRDIPCDVIYLDIHYMDGYRVFAWDSQRFPSPKKLLCDLGRDGFKPIVIIDPGVKIDPDYPIYREGLADDHFCRLKSGELFKGKVWPGEVHFPDFFKASTRRWWGKHNAEMIQAGVAGIWNDMNEPSNFLGEIDKDLIHGEDGEEISHGEAHNLYGYQMCRATYEELLAHQPDKRPFILTRSGFAGIQCYAAVWLGDNHSWWEHLAASVPMLLNMGLSGVPFVGVDVGGFCDDCNGELFARWIAMGCFTPFFRVHTAVDTIDQEPWSFGPEVETIARKYIKMRYELLPYIYDSFHEAAKTGKPVMRPLLMEFQGDSRTYGIDDAYLFGASLLIAPVYRPGMDYRALYLPEGDWYDFWTGEKLMGGKVVAVEAGLDHIPVFVRGGGIIPREPVTQYVGEKDAGYLMYEIFPSGESRYSHYEDDGSTHNYLRGDYSVTNLAVEEVTARIRIVIEGRLGGYKPHARNLLFKVHNVDIEQVWVDGKPYPPLEDIFDIHDKEGWRRTGGCVTVKLYDSGERRELIFLGIDDPEP